MLEEMLIDEMKRVFGDDKKRITPGKESFDW